MPIRSLVAFLFLAGPAWSQPQTLTTGLQSPTKMILTPRGNFLVSETSRDPNSGRLSFVSRAGVRRSLIEGLPSGIDVTLAGGGGPSAMALRERTLYLNIGPGDSERTGATPGTSMLNPQGASSPIFSSVLEIRFSAEVDSIGSTFRVTPQHQQALNDGAEVELADAGATARILLLTRFPIAEPHPVAVYKFSNPWGMALSEDGRNLYLADASQNCLLRIDTATGRWRRLARFAPFQNPTPVGPRLVDAVPTNVRIYGDSVLVSFLSGFPFASGNGRVLIVNPETGAADTFINNLTSVTDVLWRPRPGGRPQFFVLEFSANQSANPAPPGRLLRFDTAETQVAGTFITPVSMAFDEATSELFILELRGQIQQLKID
ncbi:MAG: ScyD/ScyE family protein [Acidobacteria bacterium]|nr:ScyD/ScyE family protein [Acidobacteriota bacterium]